MRLFLSLACLAAAGPVFAADPLAPGLAAGQRPGPYSSLVSVGSQRGQMHCFICETKDSPAVIVFARRLSDPLAKLVQGLDQALIDRKATDLRAWVTFLHEDESAFGPEVVRWSKQQGVRAVPLGVFQDVAGPPAYRLHRDAEVTVILFVKKEVARSFAFRGGELTEARTAEILRAIDSIAPAEKK
jgi:hypothetical protein